MSLFDKTAHSVPSEQASNQEALDYLESQEFEKYVLRLYVASNSLRSLRAIQRIRALCEERLPGRYELEIVDIYQQPEMLEQDQVFAVPTLIKRLPPPLQRLIGDMTDIEKLIVCLDL
ncbi:MAG TPA: circadian clock KaiB family protein [Leptolyngbyaceae cyanobacterium]